MNSTNLGSNDQDQRLSRDEAASVSNSANDTGNKSKRRSKKDNDGRNFK